MRSSIFTLRKFSVAAAAAMMMTAASSPAIAGYVVNATITKVRASEFNVYYVFVNTNIVRDEITTANPTSCSSAGPQSVFAFEVSTAAGKSMLNTILLAKAANSPVTIIGRSSAGVGFTGSLPCNLSPGGTATTGVESINWLEVQ
jgi:hypothetical protein